MRTLCTVIGMVALGGCVGVMFGAPKLTPVAEGLESYTESDATIRTTDFRAMVRIAGYTPDFVLAGPIVPIIPIGQWRWLTGISKDELRLAIEVQLAPLRKDAIFSPQSFRVLINNEMHTATKITVAKQGCGTKALQPVDMERPLVIDSPLCIRFDFAALRPPEQPFSIVSRELPEIKYSLKRETSMGFAGQK